MCLEVPDYKAQGRRRIPWRNTNLLPILLWKPLYMVPSSHTNPPPHPHPRRLKPLSANRVSPRNASWSTRNVQALVLRCHTCPGISDAPHRGCPWEAPQTDGALTKQHRTPPHTMHGGGEGGANEITTRGEVLWGGGVVVHIHESLQGSHTSNGEVREGKEEQPACHTHVEAGHADVDASFILLGPFGCNLVQEVKVGSGVLVWRGRGRQRGLSRASHHKRGCENRQD